MSFKVLWGGVLLFISFLHPLYGEDWIEEEEKFDSHMYFCITNSAEEMSLMLKNRNLFITEVRGADALLWDLIPVAEGIYKIYSPVTETYLAASEEGCLVHQGAGENSSQLWYIKFGEGGGFRILSKSTRKCLEVSEEGQVSLGFYKGRDNQIWKIEAAAEKKKFLRRMDIKRVHLRGLNPV